MKTGTVAKRFDVDQNTIIAWTKRFPEFFTKEALAEGQTQRDYQFEDVIVLNTIRIERSKNTTWEEIRARLGSGYRDENMPPEFTSIDGTKAISLYAELRELSAQLRKANDEIERMRREAVETENRFFERMREKDRRIEELIREAATWQVRYDQLKDRLDDEK